MMEKQCPSVVNMIKRNTYSSKYIPENYKLDCEYQAYINN